MPRTIALLTLLLALAACGRGDGGAAKPQAPASVTTARVASERWSDQLEALGTAKARESVTITAPVTQTIRSVRFDSGQFVKRGQPLVELTQGQQVAGVAEAEANLRNAEQLYARNRRLADQQLVSRADLDTQRAALESARAQVATQRAGVADHMLRAPFDGVLGLRLVSDGALVSPGTPIATLDDVSVIKLDFTLPESALTQVAVGQHINARSDAWPGETFAGTVAAVDSRIDPSVRAFTVRAEIPNPDGRLRPGMLLRVGVERSSRETLAIPELALQQLGTQASVFRVEAGDKVRQVPVEIGARRPGEVEILSGLKAGERIVVEGTVKLRDGSAIREAAKSAGNAPAAAEGR